MIDWLYMYEQAKYWLKNRLLVRFVFQCLFVGAGPYVVGGGDGKNRGVGIVGMGEGWG